MTALLLFTASPAAIAAADEAPSEPSRGVEAEVREVAQRTFDQRLVSRWGMVTSVELVDATHATVSFTSCSGDFVGEAARGPDGWELGELRRVLE